MAVTVTEMQRSRERTDDTTGPSSITLNYNIKGTNDDEAAITALADESPESYRGLARKTLAIRPVGYQWFEGSVAYGAVDDPADPSEGGGDSAKVSFDITTTTQHITNSIGNISKERNAAFFTNTPDFYGAIGVSMGSGRSDVARTDIIAPQAQWSEQYWVTNDFCDWAYRKTLYQTTGKINSGSFRGCAAGEVLFMGARGSRNTNNGLWEINYTFAYNEHAENLPVGGLWLIDKKGWEYLWVLYKDVEDALEPTLVTQPAACYVEQVYNMAVFTALGIGS